MERIRRSSASFDRVGAIALQRRRTYDASRPRIIGTVAPGHPTLRGVDMVRIDAARPTLRGLAALRERQDVPVLLDLPGPQTRRGSSPLTTTELLVFAAAEGFEWVGLRGVGSAETIHRARPFLPGSTQLTATICSPKVLRTQLGPICDAADAIHLDLRELERRRDGDLRPLLQSAISAAAQRGKPCFLTNGVLPSMLESAQPGRGEMSRLASFLDDGGAGFVLIDEVVGGDHPQTCVDLLAILTGRGEFAPTPTRRGARLGGRAVVLHGIPYLEPVTIDA